MPVAIADLDTQATYFVCEPSVVQRADPDGSGAVNHLLLGDWLKYLGEVQAPFAKVKCRGKTGWLHVDEFGTERALEVNFVDVGQGDGCHIVTPDDEVLLIDAGISDNMARFLSWRYNLRGRNVAGAPNFDPAKPDAGRWTIDHVVMSHPDEDHYGGLTPVFANPKLAIGAVYHNGIVERPDHPLPAGVTALWDLGGRFEADGRDYLHDRVADTGAMTALIGQFPATTKRQIACFRALLANNPACPVTAVSVPIEALDQAAFLPGFEAAKAFSLQILGPITEDKPFAGAAVTTLRKLGDEGVTKNGHSVIFKARYGKLTLMLGGDLNSQAQDFLLQAYAGTARSASENHAAIERLRALPQPLSASNQAKLDAALVERSQLAERASAVFECDVAKACHHGSQHVLDEFIVAVNAAATVLSSGDAEPHSHPRPDALGAYGKFGRGNRPLIFSTELARSALEFSPVVRNYLELSALVLEIEAEPDPKKKAALITKLEERRERNVAVYGMITLRALGDTVIIAQKLEVARKPSQKWDIYELTFDSDAGHFTYHPH